MLQQLAGATEAENWVIASTIFFVLVFIVVVVRVLSAPKGQHEAHARIPLEDLDGSSASTPERTGNEPAV